MIPVQRSALPEEVEARLAALTEEVADGADGLQVAKRAWKRNSFRRDTYPPVLSRLKEMAPGIDCCMYCGQGLADTVDHYVPMDADPARAFSWLNYLLACSACNSRFKRQLHAVDALGVPLLIDPTVDDPFRHIHLVLSTGEYLGISDRGEYTIATVGLNEDKRPEARCHALSVMALVIDKWWSATSSGNRSGVATAISVLGTSRSCGVFQAMLRQAAREEADLLFEGIEDKVRLLDLLRRPELRAGLSVGAVPL